MKTALKCAVVALVSLASGYASAATIIVANSLGANGMGALNTNIPNTFGDNVNLTTSNTTYTVSAGVTGVVGTPDIDLSWSRTGTSGSAQNAWQFHTASGGAPSSGGGALQMDGFAVGSTYSILFTPTATTGVKINSFNFVNDTSGHNVNYTYTVNVVDTVKAQTIATTSGVFNGSVQNTVALATVTLNATGANGDPLRMDIIRTASSSGTEGSAVDIYVDNLSFDEVPEPASIAAISLAGIGLLRRRSSQARA